MHFPPKTAGVKFLLADAFWAASIYSLLLREAPKFRTPEIKRQASLNLGDFVWTLFAIAAIAILLAIFFILKEKGKLGPI